MNHNLPVARQQFTQSVFNHKIQEVGREYALKWSFRYKWFNIALSVVLTLILLCLQFWFKNNDFISTMGVILTVFQLTFFIITLQFNFDEKTNRHRESANLFRELRDSYLILISNVKNNPKGDFNSELSRLNEKYSFVANSAPETNAKAYIETQKRLGTVSLPNSGQYSWSDTEIDSFLPSELKSLHSIENP